MNIRCLCLALTIAGMCCASPSITSNSNPEKSNLYGVWLRKSSEKSPQIALSFDSKRVIMFTEGKRDPLMQQVKPIKTPSGTLQPIIDHEYQLRGDKLVFLFRDDEDDPGLRCVIKFSINKKTLKLTQQQGDRGVPVGTYIRIK